MGKAIQSIFKYMTPTPHTIGRTQPLATAQAMMGDHRIRHLPVLDGGKLVGVITDRDLSLVAGINRAQGPHLLVEDAMSAAPFAVGPDTRLDEVVEEMARHRYGSVVVVDGGKVVGIFTAVDGLSAFAELLRARPAH
jgi:acetoin utilization protein AcuB